MNAVTRRIRAVQAGTDEGFTLVELLIVIVILGVLAGVVVFSVSGVQNNSKASSCKATVTSVNSAAEAYYAQKGSATPDLKTLVSQGFLHADSNFTATAGNNVPVGSDYNVTFVPASGSGAGSAYGALGTTAATSTSTCS